MKKMLTKTGPAIFYLVDGNKLNGAPLNVFGDLTDVRGNLSGVRGNLSGVSGDLTDVRGDLSGVRGNLSGVRGNLSGVTGDLDKCAISENDRTNGINIKDLIRD